MGRIRTVKPELIQLPRFAPLTDAAARTFYGLLALVDDCGRCPADRSFIQGQIFWGRTRPHSKIRKYLEELESAGLIRRYIAQGAEYLELVGWFDKGGPFYQQINKPQGERFPAPESIHAGNPTGALPSDYGNTPGMLPESSCSATGNPTGALPEEAGPDPIRSEAKRSEVARAHTIPPHTEPAAPAAAPADPPPTAGPNVPATSLETPPRKDIARTLPEYRMQPPILPASIARAETRRRVISAAWQYAGDRYRELGREGIEPTARDPWAGLPGASPAMERLTAIVERLLIGDEPDEDAAFAVIRGRIDVAAAEGRNKNTRRYMTPMRIWNADSFQTASELSPEQVAPLTHDLGRRPATKRLAAPPNAPEDDAFLPALGQRTTMATEKV